MLRTHHCNELTAKHVGKPAALCGWVHSKRDHGGVIFIDLRDRHGLTQVVFEPAHSKEAHAIAERAGREDVILAKGKVRHRKPGMVNRNLKTGAVELLADCIEVLNASDTPPLEVEDRVVASEETRLKYRYLDLRRPVMQARLLFRHKVTEAVREYFSKHDFMEIETPLLIRSTPEGARDYIVPSRVHPGRVYALPQSPQIYKQMLMIAGFDRYFQIARCLRDEDLRADRQPEHTQIDLEMSFVEQADVREMVEGMYRHVFKKALNIALPKFPVLTYDEAMERYGTDKPDLRFGLELVDVTEIAKQSDFNVFKQAERVKCLPVPHELTRGDIDKLIDWAKGQGSKGLAWMKVTRTGLESSITKFFSPQTLKSLRERTKAKSGVVFFIADSREKTNEILAKLRSKLGHDLKLIKEGDFQFCWVTDFPMFEWNEEEERLDFSHNPFSMPKKEHLNMLEASPEKVYAELYDVVLNGIELGSGALRINRPDVQERVFSVVGLSKEMAHKKFGFLLEAYRYGGPPHGGMGLGLDRLVALMQGLNDIREVIAFPKTKAAECPMDGSPSLVDETQLKELGLRLDIVKKQG